jgi:hypothetical protein
MGILQRWFGDGEGPWRPADQPARWEAFGPRPQRQPRDWKFNQPRVGAVVLWVISAWFGIQAIQMFNLMSGFWGPFIGSKGDFWLLYDLVITVATGLGGWYFWRKGDTTNPTWPSGPPPGGNPRPWMPGPSMPPPTFRGPSEPKPYSIAPGWYPDPWGIGGRWWDGECWTSHTR